MLEMFSVLCRQNRLLGREKSKIESHDYNEIDRYAKHLNINYAKPQLLLNSSYAKYKNVS